MEEPSSTDTVYWPPEAPKPTTVSLRLRAFTYLLMLLPGALTLHKARDGGGKLPSLDAVIEASPRFVAGCVPVIAFLWLAAYVSRKAKHRFNARFALAHLALLSWVIIGTGVALALHDGAVLQRLSWFGAALWLSVLPQAVEALLDKDARPRNVLAKLFAVPGALGELVVQCIDYRVLSARHGILFIAAKLVTAAAAAALTPILALPASFVVLRLFYDGYFDAPSKWSLSGLIDWCWLFLGEHGKRPSPELNAVEYQAYLYRWGVEVPFAASALLIPLIIGCAYSTFSALGLFGERYSPHQGGAFGWLSIVRTALSRALRTALFFAVITAVYCFDQTVLRQPEDSSRVFMIWVFVGLTIVAAIVGSRRRPDVVTMKLRGQRSKGNYGST